jgi:hypothetical protein
VQPLADPRGSLAVNIHDPDFADFKVDLAVELEQAAMAVLGEARRKVRGRDRRTEP